MPTTARNRFNTRRTVSASAAVAAAATAVLLSVQHASADEPAPDAAQDCGMETLPIPEGLQSTRIMAMSDDGSVIAYSAESLDHEEFENREQYLRLYSDGEVTDLPVTGPWEEVADVNSSGVAVGASGDYPDREPWVWRDGELSALPTEAGGEAHGINDQGDIVGVRRDPNLGTIPVVWPADGTGPVDLELPGNAAYGEATAIGDDGTIVGHITDNGDLSGNTKPYAWYPDGTAAELPLPEGIDREDAYSEPMDVTGDWATGFLQIPDVTIDRATTVRWNLADGTAETTELGYYSSPAAIAADGTVVGQSFETRAAAYQSGETVVELPGVTDSFNGDYAVEISADGSLIAGEVYVGTGDDGYDDFNAVTWTCG
ncbi:hypothetical protein GCM10029992_18970 [Glycomyces albus]